MSKTPPQAHRDVCANKTCDRRINEDSKYCSKECAKADLHERRFEEETSK